MKVIWDPRATMGRQQVSDYIRWRFGVRRKNRFMQQVRETTQMLKSNPNIGKIDPLFADRSIAYRSIIINGLSRMVYFIEGDTIYIAAFWDCRREIKSLAGEVKEGPAQGQ